MREADIRPLIVAPVFVAFAACALAAAPGGSSTQEKHYPLESLDGLRLHNVVAEPAVLEGKKGLRVVTPEEAERRCQALPAGEAARCPRLVSFDGIQFGSGVIEAEIAGEPAPGAAEGARGFVGVAFRVQEDFKTFDVFYLRPTNGRADDQERRNHAVQYMSQPEWPWSRLRKEFPSRYESYVDLLPGVWTRIKIEVRGERARLYVHGQEQPSLIVNDVKSGANTAGAVALFLDRGTLAHFRNVKIAIGLTSELSSTEAGAATRSAPNVR